MSVDDILRSDLIHPIQRSSKCPMLTPHSEILSVILIQPVIISQFDGYYVDASFMNVLLEETQRPRFSKFALLHGQFVNPQVHFAEVDGTSDAFSSCYGVLKAVFSETARVSLNADLAHTSRQLVA